MKDAGGTVDRRVRSHSPQSITSCEDREIMRMAVPNRSVTLRTVAQHNEFLTHPSEMRVTFDAIYSRVVHKTSIAWSTLDAEPQTSPPLMVL
ncbi:hypothetical protein TNCV_3352601 [Trichonephila clavipes]|nr:hypothetical protein TNCV_3352601 [Trichonephila clavipes]